MSGTILNEGAPMPERTSFRVAGTLRDADGAAVPAAALSALRLTLTDQATGRVVNSRYRQSVLNANGVSVDSDGALEWLGSPADSTVAGTIAEPGGLITLVALFEFEWDSGAKGGRLEVQILVRRLASDGKARRIVRGDDYTGARALVWTNPAGTWPDLTGAAVTLTVRKVRRTTSEPTVVLTKVGTVVTASGPGQQVRAEPTHGETTACEPGTHQYDLQATLAGGDVVTLAGPLWPFAIDADQTRPTA